MRRFYALGALVAVAAIVVVVALVLSKDDPGTTADTVEEGTTTSTVFPYDFVEADSDVEVDTLKGAKFASLTVVTGDGIESYLLAAGSRGFTALTDALDQASEGRHEPSPNELAPGEVAGSTVPADSDLVVPGVNASTLTYVMDDRSTYTLVVDTERGILYRGTQEWRPTGDLAALIEAATVETTP